MSAADRRRFQTEIRFVAALVAFACIAANVSARAESLVFGEPIELDEPIEATGGGPFVTPKTAGADTDFLVLWRGNRHGTRVSPEDGAVLDPAGIPTWNDVDPFLTASTVLLSNGDTYLVGEYLFGKDYSDHLVLADSAGVPMNEIEVSVDRDPIVAAMPGGDYLSVWEDGEDGSSTVRAVRIDGKTGELLDDPEGIVIASEPFILSVAAAGDDRGFTVVYTTTDTPGCISGASVTLHAVRIFEDGTVSSYGDQSTFDIVGSPTVSAVASSLGTFVLWTSYEDPDAKQIYGAKIEENSVPIVSLLYETDRETDIYPMTAAAGTSDIVVIWQEQPTDSFSDVFIHGEIITEGDDGQTLLVASDFVVNNAEGAQTDPSVAFLKDTYLAVWTDTRIGTDYVYGARIRDGALLDPDGLLLTAAPNTESRPKAAMCDDRLLAVWYDSRSVPQSRGGDVMGVRMTLNGEVSDAPANDILTSTLNDYPLDIVPFGTSCLVLSAASSDVDDDSFHLSKVDMASFEITDSAFDLDVPASRPGTYMNGALAVTDNGVFALLTRDGSIYAANVTDPDNPVVGGAPIFTVRDPDSYVVLSFQAAALGDSVLLSWVEYDSHSLDFQVLTNYLQRLRENGEGALEPVGDLIESEYEVIGIGVLGERFVVITSQQHTDADLMVIPKTDNDEIERLQDVFISQNWMYGATTAPFNGGLLIVYDESVSSGNSTALSALLLDDALNVRIAPTRIPGESQRPAIVPFKAPGDSLYEDRAFIFSAADLYDSSRIVARTVDIVPWSNESDTETDAQDTEDYDDTDSIQSTDTSSESEQDTARDSAFDTEHEQASDTEKAEPSDSAETQTSDADRVTDTSQEPSAGAETGEFGCTGCVSVGSAQRFDRLSLIRALLR
jgi:hypothetical protein